MPFRFIPNPIGRLGSAGALSPVGASLSYLQRVQALSPIAYWPLNEAAGTSGAGSVLDASGNGRTGTPTTITFGGMGIGDGQTAAQFTAAGSLIDVYGSSLAAAFSAADGSILLWNNVDTAVWASSTPFTLIEIGQDTSNRIDVLHVAANALRCRFRAGGTLHSPTDKTISAGGWFHVGVTWSKSNNRIRWYVGGAQVGSDTAYSGTWSGALAATWCRIGNDASGAGGSIGYQQHVSIFTSELSAAAIVALAAV